MPDKLIQGFPSEEEERVSKSLSKFIKHLEKDGFVIVGGLAIRHHLTLNNIEFEKTPFNDIDFIAKDASVFKPSVTEDFWIYHYHHPAGACRFFMATVDPELKMKNDVFDIEMFPNQGTTDVDFEGQTLKIRGIEDQLVTEVLEGARLLIQPERYPIEPKKIKTIELLEKIADVAKCEKYWQKSNISRLDKMGKYTKGYSETLAELRKTLEEKPELIIKDVMKKHEPYVCKGCTISPDYPITPMEKVYKLLGYVE